MPTKTRINGQNYTQLPRLVSDDIILKGLPQTAGAPEGYGDVADTVNALYTGNALGRFTPAYTKLSSVADVSLVSGDATFTYGVAPNGLMGVKVTCSAVSRISVVPAIDLYFDGYISLAGYGGVSTGTQSVRLDAFENIASNKLWFQSQTFATSPLNTYTEQGGARTIAFGRHTLGQLNSPSNSFPMAKMEVRITPVTAQTSEFWIFGVGVLTPKRKSRICIVYDDAYTSALKLGLAPWNSRSIPVTTAVIPTLIDAGNASYMGVDELKCWLNSGNSIVAHGPIGGGGSLVDNYTNPLTRVQQSVDDIKYTIDWIKEKGLASQYYDRCYIWPQGKFQWSSGDTSLLDAVLAEGINTARAALPTGAFGHRAWDGLTKYNRLSVPHIGHNWAGTTAAEATNIANIVSIINALSTAGGVDFHLMLHKVVPDATADDSMDISIRISDLNTIAAAVKTNIDSGLLEAVTMPQTVIDSNVWNKI